MKKKYNYYSINIPSDCEENKDRRFDLAIIQAKEKSRLYCMPCNWRLISDNGETVKICRESMQTYNRFQWELGKVYEIDIDRQKKF